MSQTRRLCQGGANPTGTITFQAFGPDNPTRTGTPRFISVKTVSGNGAYRSDVFTPPGSGTYRFVVRYSGDANNVSITSVCGAITLSVESPGFGPPPLPRAGAGPNVGFLNQGGSLGGIPTALLMLAALGLMSGSIAYGRRNRGLLTQTTMSAVRYIGTRHRTVVRGLQFDRIEGEVPL